MPEAHEHGKKSMINVVLADKNALYRAYMPFVKGGGLFVTTEHQYEQGDPVFIRLKLPDDPAPVPVACKVVWLSSSLTGEKGFCGAGLQFTDDDGRVKTRIEHYLAGVLGSDKPTDTM